MRKRGIIAALVISFLGLTSCSLKQEGWVLMLDEAYRADIFATNKDGIASPDGLLWNKGKLYLADEGGLALSVWSRDAGTKTLCDERIGVLSPEDLVIDSDGNIFFTDDDAGGLWEVDKRGQPRLVAGKDNGLISTEGIALSPDGDLLVGDGEQHKVFRVTRSGEVSTFLGTEYRINKPESMVFDERGNLYIADNRDNIVYLLDPKGELRILIDGRNGMLSPETIFYFDGTLYITDSQAGRVCRYTPKEGLKTIAAFGGKLKNVQGITVDELGDIYITVQTNIPRKIGYILRISTVESP
jgi:sugar lactone lactonase YvrE